MKSNFSMRASPSSSLLAFEDVHNSPSGNSGEWEAAGQQRGAGASAFHVLIFTYSTLPGF